MESRDEYSVKFGIHLRLIRRQRSMSLRELALEMGSDKPTLSKIENGHMVPSVYFLKRICWGLKISEREFFEDFS